MSQLCLLRTPAQGVAVTHAIPWDSFRSLVSLPLSAKYLGGPRAAAYYRAHPNEAEAEVFANARLILGLAKSNTEPGKEPIQRAFGTMALGRLAGTAEKIRQKLQLDELFTHSLSGFKSPSKASPLARVLRPGNDGAESASEFLSQSRRDLLDRPFLLPCALGRLAEQDSLLQKPRVQETLWWLAFDLKCPYRNWLFCASGHLLGADQLA